MVIFGSEKKHVISALFFYFLTIVSGCNLPQYYNDFDSRFDWHDDIRFGVPDPPLGETYSFIVLADLHINIKEDAEKFANIKSKLIPGDRFIVIAGDITTEGTREQIQYYLNAVNDIGLPCYPVIGNHDIHTERGKAWKELIGSTIYRIDSPGTSLFILDNANAAFGYEQLDWLERELGSAEKNTFVFAHQNFFIDSSPPDFEQVSDIRERAMVMSLLENRCDVMFMGHLHKRIIKEFNGVNYIVLDKYEQNSGIESFCRVHVSKTGISWEFDRSF